MHTASSESDPHDSVSNLIHVNPCKRDSQSSRDKVHHDNWKNPIDTQTSGLSKGLMTLQRVWFSLRFKRPGVASDKRIQISAQRNEEGNLSKVKKKSVSSRKLVVPSTKSHQDTDRKSGSPSNCTHPQYDHV